MCIDAIQYRIWYQDDTDPTFVLDYLLCDKYADTRKGDNNLLILAVL